VKRSVLAPPVGAGDLLPDEYPGPIARPVMLHRWEHLAFLHWPYHPGVLQRLLPPSLVIDTFDGAAWVGLIPFRLRIRLPALAPEVPWLSGFPEVNLRTYVRGPDGRTGIWFLSLEAPRLLPVLAARSWYGLPYAWARMRQRRTGGLVLFESRRLWSPGHASSRILLEEGDALCSGEITDLERFLTARFGLWSPGRRGLAYTQVDHPPWRLRRARLLHLEEDLLEAAGLPRPTTTPLVRSASSVEVRFGRRVLVPAEAPSSETPSPGG
jgi:uncharacterized protein YqjF (DUF2071 family)